MRPLDGLRVLDFTHAAAGPFATMFMADMGAEVIKIEKPGRGDGARFMGEPMGGRDYSDYYVSLNRNKKGALLDLSKPEAITLARKLASVSDFVVQNFRPGVMERLGLGFDALAPLRDGLVYCSISAFGSSGPWVERPANDVIMQSVSGLMSITGEPDGGPVRIGAPISDYSTGLFALVGMLAAHAARESHPEGQHVEVSMIDSSLAMMCNYIPSVVGLDKEIMRLGRGHAQIVPYQAFTCSDGEYVMVGAFTTGFWRRLCGVLGKEEWIEDRRFLTNADRLRNRDELLEMMEALFLQRTRDEWAELLRQADVPSGPVQSLNEATKLPQVIHNRTIREIDRADDAGPLHVAGFPVRVDQWEDRGDTAPPHMGQHTIEVLSTILNLDIETIDSLERSGAIGSGGGPS